MHPCGIVLCPCFLVLARMTGGEIVQSNRLDQVWALVGDKPAFTEFVRSEINQMLPSADSKSFTEPEGDVTEIPIPTADSVDLPVPAIPVPE